MSDQTVEPLEDDDDTDGTEYTEDSLVADEDPIADDNAALDPNPTDIQDPEVGQEDLA